MKVTMWYPGSGYDFSPALTGMDAPLGIGFAASHKRSGDNAWEEQQADVDFFSRPS